MNKTKKLGIDHKSQENLPHKLRSETVLRLGIQVMDGQEIAEQQSYLGRDKSTRRKLWWIDCDPLAES